jgi:hypothetical protein
MRDGEALAKQLESGQPLEARHRAMLPPSVPATIQFASGFNDLPATLEALGDMCQRQAELRVAALPAIITPAFVLLIGLLVAFVVLALLLPMLSLIAHLSLAHWVYKVVFHPADLAPLLLGMAVLVGHCDHHVTSLGWRMRMQLILPFVAVAMSAIKFPAEMVFPLGPIQVSPLRVALAGATIVYLDGLWLHRHILFAWAAGMSAGGLFLGHSVKNINDNSVQMAQRSADALDRLIPKTLFDWGVVSIMAAFLLLGLGALISLTRRTVTSDDGDDG